MISRPFSLAYFLPVAALLLFETRPALAQPEAYYLLMFGSQRTPPDPAHAHTFATFVRVRYDGPQPGIPVIEAHTISWLPANLNIRVLALLPEPGHNFDLEATLRYAEQDCQRVSLWGPYQIHVDLYCHACKQLQLLESGQVRYKSIDSGYHTNRVSNCIHAVGSVVDGHRIRVFSPGWGETASFAVLNRFTPWIIDMQHTHPWVGSAVGLNMHPIIYRNFEHPRSGEVRRVTSRIFGLSPDTTATYGPPR